MISIAVNQIMDALKAALQPYTDGATFIRGQFNRAPLPVGNCVVLTEIINRDLAVSYVQANEDPAQQNATIHGDQEFDVQADFYGDNAGENAAAINMVCKSAVLDGVLPEGISILYATQANQSPLITGEIQFATRWTLTIKLQIKPVITIAEQSADALSINLIEPTQAIGA